MVERGYGRFTVGDVAARAGVACDIGGPAGLAILRLVIALPEEGEARDQFLAERGKQLQTMLDRARARGEHPPDAVEVLDHILAPLYIRTLFGTGPLTPEYVDALVDRL
ncbi:TetR-like C-terminal domain-containing protein [Amycolatopsis japonica]|uniref:TetR-like C-terminal domain-containing protein n=1 Tax=Amycolatopsis japonica TaxID=208439 RepID=UPI0033DF47B1